MPIEHKLLVQCKSLLEGDAAERLCRVACPACGKCALDAAPGVIAMTNGLAVVDYAKNDLAGPEATRRCPTGAIVWVEGAQFAAPAPLGAGGGRRRRRFGKREQEAAAPKYPGVPTAVDGRTAVVQMETAASEATAAWGDEGWTAAAVTAGLSLAGLRARRFATGQGVAALHESLYAAAGKRLPYVLNVACRAMAKQGPSGHAAAGAPPRCSPSPPRRCSAAFSARTATRRASRRSARSTSTTSGS